MPSPPQKSSRDRDRRPPAVRVCPGRGCALVRRATLALAIPLAAAGSDDKAPQTPVEPLPDTAPFAAFAKSYCTRCHNPEKVKGEVDLETFAAAAPRLEDREIWTKIGEKLAAREMPPEKSKAQPDEAERAEIIALAAAVVAALDAAAPDNPGRVTVRRLNRNEYNNTVRDLLGVGLRPADAFPADEVGYGFDNIGDVLSLSPVLLERYLDAAEKLAAAAVLPEVPPFPPVERFEAEKMEFFGGDHVRPVQNRLLGMYREGGGRFVFNAPADGSYEIRARAHGDQAGPEPPRLAFLRDGEELGAAGIRSTGANPTYAAVRAKLKQGPNPFAIAYTNNYNVQDHPDPKLRGDRNLYVDYVTIKGPLGAPPPPLPETHTRILPLRRPPPGRERSYAREVLQRFASRAYRRPASAEEAERLERFVSRVTRDGGTFEEGIRLALQAVLVSPHFLYRWELDAPGPGAGRSPGGEPTSPGAPRPEDTVVTRALKPYEMASRLSYFLWASMPDEELFARAADGSLTEPNVLAAQTRRMLADPKASALVRDFAGQWLQTRNLVEVAPDPALFPDFDDELRAAMAEETERFFAAVVKEDRSVTDLLGTDFTFLNGRLAKHYGIGGVEGPAFRRVALEPGGPRGGVLTQASILTITSNPTRTSPVIRGKWVLEQILGTPPPPPPADVEPLEEGAEVARSASLRERMEKHRDKPDCRGCHAKMDPIGFAFENFDAIGRWRDFDGAFPIDPSGTLPGGESIDGPADLVAVLKGRGDFTRNFAAQLLTFALGRGTEYYDQPTIDAIAAAAAEGENRFSRFVLAVVASDPFRQRRIN